MLAIHSLIPWFAFQNELEMRQASKSFLNEVETRKGKEKNTLKEML